MRRYKLIESTISNAIAVIYVTSSSDACKKLGTRQPHTTMTTPLIIIYLSLSRTPHCAHVSCAKTTARLVFTQQIIPFLSRHSTLSSQIYSFIVLRRARFIATISCACSLVIIIHDSLLRRRINRRRAVCKTNLIISAARDIVVNIVSLSVIQRHRRPL